MGTPGMRSVWMQLRWTENKRHQAGTQGRAVLHIALAHSRGGQLWGDTIHLPLPLKKNSNPVLTMALGNLSAYDSVLRNDLHGKKNQKEWDMI